MFIPVCLGHFVASSWSGTHWELLHMPPCLHAWCQCCSHKHVCSACLIEHLAAIHPRECWRTPVASAWQPLPPVLPQPEHRWPPPAAGLTSSGHCCSFHGGNIDSLYEAQKNKCVLAFPHVWASYGNRLTATVLTLSTLALPGSKVKQCVERPAGGGKSGRIMLLPVSCWCVGETRGRGGRKEASVSVGID